ncbi:arsenate reductase (glutaredoxin) [Fulvivirga lutimaris]|uniref:arsenate reductase (glutaredoxin) n=1 Tax=Fulvivirga lutimaris TaxID=1819566 RepID=UPI0012BCE4E7|nr:arsenate reductase (glutaredoxin) [Fulvivirga lutimaris]MTI40865.1 arsenate reductase (glutaredoxin) [Fulvivirga lutimaris]
MSDLSIFHNPRCGKSRNTLAIINEKNLDIEVVEYLKTPPSAAQLEAIVKKLGIKPEELIRKGEKVFKENYKGKQLTESDWIKAMVEHPILIERPIVIKGDKAVIGRPPENVLSII